MNKMRGIVARLRGSGKILTDAEAEALADEAERGYDIEHLEWLGGVGLVPVTDERRAELRRLART